MGSEGYLINQFLVERTNFRTDEWGGSYENRMKLPVEIVKAVREACGEVRMLSSIRYNQKYKPFFRLASLVASFIAGLYNYIQA